MDYESLLDLVRNRRSIRRFEPTPIPDEYVDKIIEVARWSPSAFNTQPWEFVVVKKKELKDKIMDAISGKGRKDNRRNAPVFIILLGDWRAKVGLPANTQEHPEYVIQFFYSSLASAFLYMHLAAASLGLGSQWCSMSRFTEVEPVIRDVVGIPEGLKVYDMMVVGYSAFTPLPKLVRDREDIVHYGDCGPADFRTEEEVVDYAKRTKAWNIANR